MGSKLSFHSEDKNISVRLQKIRLNLKCAEVIQNDCIKFIDLVPNTRKLTFKKDVYARSSEVDPIVRAIGAALGRKYMRRSDKDSVKYILDDHAFY